MNAQRKNFIHKQKNNQYKDKRNRRGYAGKLSSPVYDIRENTYDKQKKSKNNPEKSKVNLYLCFSNLSCNINKK